ncbi:single-stranded DNA-binding protein [Carboxydothermus pertinax]|uniref:Single-stranded DNA-binding protein n=1 Tax=Carboxydothermus pertinax TaxID=870242 RepID=A0A1L8CW30_9THEO|nr:single-stranded DNA-binding protein [Carboxydothermus pertinax]GAV23155.1 single-strand-binding protein [Carboxydothermus pertinax]
MFNKVILIGRLTRDPELRHTPQGTPVASITVAVDRPFTTKEGQRETDFIDVVVWQKLAETVARVLSKGRLIMVEGRLQIRSYTDKEGQKRRVYEVVGENVRFLDKPKTAGVAPATAGEFPAVDFDPADFGTEIEISDEDIPF